MKKILFVSFLIVFHLNVFAQKKQITYIEIYGVRFEANYNVGLDWREIKKSGLYVRVQDSEEIHDIGLISKLSMLEINKKEHMPFDFRAVLIVHYNNKKKETYYFASGTGGIIKNNILYKANYPLIAAIYSFFPDDYFIAGYKDSPELYK